MSNAGSLTGQFLLADLNGRMKCAFFDAMHGEVSAADDPRAASSSESSSSSYAIDAPRDVYGLLRFAHNFDSPLGTGLVRAPRKTMC